MENQSTNYREKYRQAVVDQERMEKQFKFQMDALRKTLFHLMSSVQGLDSQLDASLILLKEKMRGAPGQQVLEQMERVQVAASSFDQLRQQSVLDVATHLESIVDQLVDLQVPAQLKTSLKSFSAGLSERAEAYQNYPELLAELAKLQALALQAASNPPSSLWQRLKGGTTLKNDAPPEKHAGVTHSPSTADDISRADMAVELEHVAEGEMDLTPRQGELIEAQTEYFDPGDEDSYYKVAQRIAHTLENLLARIEPDEIVKHKIDMVRSRIKRGMDWYVLAVTLEDIRDIFLLRYLQNDKEFSEYLKHINNELRAITEILGLATKTDAAYRERSENLSNAVSDQLSALRNNMDTHGDIQSLKAAVKDHLSVIHQALGDFKSTTQRETSLTEQLTALIDRVQNIESESLKTKELLEEERYRATHDTLTGIANREAYNERAFQELQRYKRYCRPLTLAVCDLDHFKKINDTYGHQAGDKVLKLIAKLISTRLRKVDFVARYGGEEFVMLMPETPIQQALTVLDKIRAVVAKTPFQFKGSPVTITLSFGLALFEPDDSVENVFERADKALYKAKKQGRNQCVIAENPPEK